MEKINWEEYYDESEDSLIEFFNDYQGCFGIKISKESWDNFDKFIRNNNIKLNRGNRTLNIYKKKLNECKDYICIFIKGKSKLSFNAGYYRDFAFEENGGTEYLNQSGYKIFYDFENDEIIKI